MANAYLITNGRIVDPANSRDEVSDLCISGQKIVRYKEALPEGYETIDASGLVVAPGFIDLHVHFREPGNEDAETLESGSKAAARGGFSSVVTMPNTSPPNDSYERVRNEAVALHRLGFVRDLPSACITANREGKELADLKYISEAAVPAFTDDGNTVADEALMRQAMVTVKELNKVIMDHALDASLAQNGAMHEGAQSKKLGIPGIPSEAETAIVRRDIALSRETGCRVHIQHVSCAESVDLIRAAQKEGLPVSGEATPHHLTFTDADVSADNTNTKMNPPLREEADRQAILAGVADGTLCALATDHAPHTGESKAQPFAEAPFGVIGLETAIGATYTTLVQSGKMSLADWIRRWTAGPAELLQLGMGDLTPGTEADVVLLDLDTSWTVQASDFLSKSDNSPFIGKELTGQAVMTFLAGKRTWNGRS